VVSLPRWFVFRFGGDDPHPVPWIRVRLSAAMGAALYPHPQWTRIADLWSALYPLSGAPATVQPTLRLLDRGIAEFVRLLVAHQPRSLGGASIGSVLRIPNRQPEPLLRRYAGWRAAPERIDTVPPALAFAVIGQARAAGLLQPEQESRLVGRLLTGWAVRSSLDTTVLCAGSPARRAVPAA
jgi:hypothetical protein